MTRDYARRNWRNRPRWALADALNRLPGTCWANLVSFALHSAPLIDRKGESDIRQDDMCRSDAARNGRCYCGKIGGAS